MPRIEQTQVTSMHVRTRALHPLEAADSSPKVEWIEPQRKHRGESLLKNMAVASALVLCAVTLRTGAIPPLTDAADAVLTAATDNSLLDDQLGKLSFVSALFPEAVLVFGESSPETLSAPVNAGIVVHAWSEAEPYMSWRTDESRVTSACDGEVIGVYHGNGDERLVQVMGSDGVACLYGNLAEVFVQTGEAVTAGTVLGELLPGEDCVFELRQDGRSIDPSLLFAQ